MTFEEEIFVYLQKCELDYRAKHKPSGSCVPWLAPYCNHSITAKLRSLGFRVKNTQKIDDAMWAETTSGILVFVNSDDLQGFVAGAYR